MGMCIATSANFHTLIACTWSWSSLCYSTFRIVAVLWAQALPLYKFGKIALEYSNALWYTEVLYDVQWKCMLIFL